MLCYCIATVLIQLLVCTEARAFFGVEFPKLRPSFLKSFTGRRLELDGYCEALALAFEYQGEQHYDEQHYWNRLGGDFETLRARDELKVALCEAAGVRLVVVPCFVRDLETFVRLYLLRWFSVAEVFPVLVSSQRGDQLKGY